MSIDTIGDFLTIIRNGLMVRKRNVTVPCSNLKIGMAQVLKDEGFIRNFEKVEDEEQKPFLKIILKYVNGESAINEISRVSRPGRRKYERAKGITSVIGGLGVAILSTSSGIMTDKQAREKSIGGEVLCHIW